MNRATHRCRRPALAIALLGLCAAFVGAGVVQAAPADEQQIAASLDRLAQAWNAADAAAWAQEYWPEGELINILGLLYITPADIRARTAEIFAGPFRGSHFAFKVRRMRLLGAGAAIVDTDITVTDFHGLRGVAPTRPAELVTRMKHIYERRHGSWRIVASQNTAVAP